MKAMRMPGGYWMRWKPGEEPVWEKNDKQEQEKRVQYLPVRTENLIRRIDDRQSVTVVVNRQLFLSFPLGVSPWR